MGTINHNAIIVTGWNEKLEQAHGYAKVLFHDDEYSGCKVVSEIIGTGMNQYMTFMIAPDGSKEYWDMSDKYDELRKKFIEHLDSYAYDDGSSSINYIHVSYGELGTEIHDTNCEDRQ